MKILLTDRLGQTGMAFLKKHANVDERYGLSKDQLMPFLSDIDGWMVRSGTQVTAELMANAPKLRVVARAGSGVDNVDVPDATRRGILVVNAPGGNAVSAAEMTVGLLLSCVRRIPQANASLRKGKWNREAFKGFEISGKKIGLLGLGAVGKHVARILNGFGATVLAYDPFVDSKKAEEIGVTLRTSDEVIAESDIISVHVPLTPKTCNLISKEAFSSMKKGVVLLNAARGGVVDEACLLEALDSGIVSVCGLDVFEKEPVPAGSFSEKLIRHERVVATPHLGASTTDAQEKVALLAAEQLVFALQGKQVTCAVNEPAKFAGASF